MKLKVVVIGKDDYVIEKEFNTYSDAMDYFTLIVKSKAYRRVVLLHYGLVGVRLLIEDELEDEI